MVFLLALFSLSGLGLTTFGLLLLFKKGFVEKLLRGLWKKPESITIFSEHGRYVDGKYVQGIGALISGLILLSFVIYFFTL